MKRIKKILLLAGRMVEHLVTGDSDYQLYSEKGVVFDYVTDKTKAKMIAEEMKIYLKNNFDIHLKRPVILELFEGDMFNLKGIWRDITGVKGQYHYENLGKNGIAHMIYIRKGLNKNEFKAVLAHEMTHAFLREEQLMGCHRYLREGFARWVEYKILMDIGMENEAEKILNLKKYEHGKEVEKILRLEKKVGARGVMEIIGRID